MEKQWFNKEVKDVEKELGTNLEKGLSSIKLTENKEKYGLNELKEKKKESLIKKFIAQFKDFSIIVLIIAAIVSGAVGVAQGEGFTDTIIILIVVLLNAVIGVAQESKAEKSLEALKKLSEHAAKVIRDGKEQIIPARELVPGDIVIIETGDYVSADLRIVEAVNLKAQESSLTGESVPVEKEIKAIEGNEIGIGDRVNMLFSSSLITYGRGKAVVVETGMNTEVGKIAGMLNNTEKQETPLQTRLNSLGKTLGIAALAICAVIFVIGLLQGKSVVGMFMTAVSLAVAVIPEGLVAVSTIVLAIGVQKMVKKHAIVKKLPAVETLGSSTVICSDKTGTLTQNKMTVEKIFCNDTTVDLEKVDTTDDFNKLVYNCMLCNDSRILENGEITGDPTETALIDMALKQDYEQSIYRENKRVEEIPFDSERKLMTTVNENNGKYTIYTKGGVDELLKICNSYLFKGEVKTNIDEYANWIRENNEDMAKDALRVLAFAYKEIDHKPSKEEMKTIESGLTFIGMVGMIDPPREEAKKAVEKCKHAGIKTVMITGDHKITAVAIAKKLGILENENEALTGLELDKISDEQLTKDIRKYSVYARVSPEHKVRIVKAWQANGEVVAMTGDGVNDSPALKTSDIGCAMGKVGTEVAKEAADVILTDDNFATIVSAVEEGRRIYDNILKVIQFLISCNVGEVIVLLLATLFAPAIASWFGISDVTMIQVLLPIHILWINLVTDTFPALALAFDPANKDVMNRNPIKKDEGIFTKGRTFRIIYQGVMIGLLTLIAFLIGLATPDDKLPTMISYENQVISAEEIDNLDEVLANGGEYISKEEIKIEIGQTMVFIVLAFSELVHVFNIRDNKNSIFKTGILGNPILIWAVLVSAFLMVIILTVPALRHVFSIPILPLGNMIEVVALVLAPIAIVELLKLFKVNTVAGE